MKSHFVVSFRFVEPWTEHATKKSYCLFHPYSPAQLLPVKLDPNEGTLHILVRANLKEDPKVTGSAHALFVKGFYIKEPGKVGAFSLSLARCSLHEAFLFTLTTKCLLMQLNLTPSCNHSVITIDGNTGMRKIIVCVN